MKISKQMRDGLILGGVVLVLVIVVFNFIRETRSQPPAAPIVDAPAPAEEAANPASAAPMLWVKETRLSRIPTEVRGGRDPFQDLTYVKPAPPRPDPPPAATVMPALLPSEPIIERTVALKWITWDMLSARLGAAVGELPVNVRRGEDAYHAQLSGTKLELQQVYGILPALDTPPPMTLAGVIVGSGARMAVISVNGRTYTLYEGEVVPTLGWTLAKVTSTEAILRKGPFSESLRLAGGKS